VGEKGPTYADLERRLLACRRRILERNRTEVDGLGDLLILMEALGLAKVV